MTARRQRRTFSDGPPKWAYTSWGIVAATAHLVVAGFDVGRFFDLWTAAWPFYLTLIGITTASAVTIYGMGKKAGEPSPTP